MRADLNTDATGDIVLSNHDLDITTGSDLNVQELELSAHIHRGEFLTDVTDGIPWREFFTTRPANQFAINGFLQAYFEGYPGIKRITEISSTLDAEARQTTIFFSYIDADESPNSGEIII